MVKSLLERWHLSSEYERNFAMPNEEERSKQVANLEDSQLRLIFTGEGGTGKSRVIHALSKYVKEWNKMGDLAVTSTTGKSAKLINGRTIHSVLISLKNSPAAYKNLNMIIIDEMSMMGKQLLIELDMLLQVVKGIKKPFGLTSIVLVANTDT
eukprot:Awhi_evm2s7823